MQTPAGGHSPSWHHVHIHRQSRSGLPRHPRKLCLWATWCHRSPPNQRQMDKKPGAMAWIFVSPLNSYTEILSPVGLEGTVSGKLSGDESRAHTVRPVSFFKGTPESSPTPSRWGYSKETPSMSQEVSSQQTSRIYCTSSGLPAFRTLRNQCLLFVSPPVCGVPSTEAWRDRDTGFYVIFVSVLQS